MKDIFPLKIISTSDSYRIPNFQILPRLTPLTYLVNALLLMSWIPF